MTPADSPTAALDELIALTLEQRLEKVRSQNSPGAYVATLSDAAQKLTFVEAARALISSETLIELADRLNLGGVRARTRRTRAQALAYCGRFDEALEACVEARKVALETDDAVEAARAQLAMMHPLGELGRFDDAVEMAERARAGLNAAGEPLLGAKADLNLGAIFQNRDDPVRALFHLDRAMKALGNEPLSLGLVQNNRGEALLRLDQFAAAEVAFADSLEQYSKAGATLVAAIAEGNLADLAARRGQMQKSLFHFERARRRLEGDTAASHLARMIAEQAEAQANLGLTRDALRAYESVLPQLDACGLNAELARAHAGMAECLTRLGKFSDARAWAKQSAAKFAELGNPTERARVLLLCAELARAEGDLATAHDDLAQAAEGLSQRPTDLGTLGYLTARLALSQGDLTRAFEAVNRAITSVEELDIAPLLADLLHLRGLVLAAQGQGPSAVGDLRAAVAQVERVRGSFQADRFRAAALGNRLTIYEDLVRGLLDTGNDALQSDAFRIVEKAKSRSLLDQTRGTLDSTGPSDPQSDRLTEEANRLRGDINALYAKLAETSQANLPVEWRAAVHARERELTQIENRLAASRGPASLFAPPCGLEQVHAALSPEGAFVEYFGTGDELSAWVITRDAAQVFRGLLKIADADAFVQRLRFQLSRAMRPGAADGVRGARLLEDTRRELGWLWSHLIAPLSDALGGASRIIVAPHGSLHAAPFHAFWDGRHHWIERASIGYSPSASVWLGLRDRDTAGRTNRMLIVSVADEIAPRIEQEAHRLAAVTPSARLLIGKDATAAGVSPACAEADLIHFACHARFDPEFPQASGLKIGDGWLTLRDIYQLRLKARLITLGACDSGRSSVQAGDELLGIYRALLAVGADSVLASFWPVHDEISEQMFERFYRIIADDDEANDTLALLRAEQLRLLQSGLHPVFWAPYFLVGNV